MIILDTNIISEMMKKTPSSAMLDWVNGQEVTQLFITTPTIAEIIYGIRALPEGNRQHFLEEAFNKSISDAFKHRILSFDETAAHLYGKIMSHKKKTGRTMSILDGQIAAIALAHKAALATRNTRDFTNCQLELINPFNQNIPFTDANETSKGTI